MRTETRFKALVAAAVLVFAATGLALAKDDSATVGWFVSEVAKARGLTVATESEAISALKGSGVVLPALDLGKTLTEGDVVAIGHAVGVTTTSKTPNAPFTRTRAQAFLSTFGSEIAGRGDDSATPRDIGGSPNDASNNGKGKKKGHNKSSSEPL
ncbi:MAG TPA: hypothetical protein VJ826_10475 [Candidatus Polarisedimenticolaceae bacterium]|nr:hypothetical protein [Candidatus Polarisedimenticolaceae bacterium]